MKKRARSIEDKTYRIETLLESAELLAIELGGIRHLTLGVVAEHAGIHRTGVFRYFESKEELLLELAERGWIQWQDALRGKIANSSSLEPKQLAAVITETICSLPVFCDLLTHVTLNLEGDVGIERARQYKTNTFRTYDSIVEILVGASIMTAEQIQNLLTVALPLAAALWQVSHPTPTLAELYKQVPRWSHVALDFEPRLKTLLQACAAGL